VNLSEKEVGQGVTVEERNKFKRSKKCAVVARSQSKSGRRQEGDKRQSRRILECHTSSSICSPSPGKSDERERERIAAGSRGLD
jgi:hypothetical protein